MEAPSHPSLTIDKFVFCISSLLLLKVRNYILSSINPSSRWIEPSNSYLYSSPRAKKPITSVPLLLTCKHLPIILIGILLNVIIDLLFLQNWKLYARQQVSISSCCCCCIAFWWWWYNSTYVHGSCYELKKKVEWKGRNEEKRLQWKFLNSSLFSN